MSLLLSWLVLMLSVAVGAIDDVRGTVSSVPTPRSRSVADVDAFPPVVPNGLSAAIERALPAVVKLYGAKIGSTRGYGTGTTISPDGLIITIDSVLLDTPNLRAVLNDGRRFHAELVRRDPTRELALLRVQANRLPHLPLESSAGLAAGDVILAAGNGFRVAEGEEEVGVMRGVLSARASFPLRRRTALLDYGGELLVIDAITSNPGMPGGPVLDVDGRLVGLIGPIADATPTNTRLNYAIPVEQIAAFVRSEAGRPSEPPPGPASDQARPKTGYLGIRLFALGYRKRAPYVDRVDPGSPAESAGIRSDDLIVAIDDQRVADAAQCQTRFDGLQPGQRLRLTVKRGERIMTVDLLAREASP